jgi:4-hydroxyphenylpyruvate dioxygenase
LSVQHLVFRADDIFAAAKALKANGFVPLQISPNYYDNIEARFAAKKRYIRLRGMPKTR